MAYDIRITLQFNKRIVDVSHVCEQKISEGRLRLASCEEVYTARVPAALGGGQLVTVVTGRLRYLDWQDVRDENHGT